MRTLVVGCDASGKSTFLEAVSSRFGDSLVESTSTEESRAFKLASMDRPVDVDYINERERLYLKLTREALDGVVHRGHKDFIGTDATLVTRLSHAVMRQCISGPAVDIESIIEDWVRDEEGGPVDSPDIIVLTHAPFELIKNRIESRQQAGQSEEKFWGFNSPFFLKEYQAAWGSTIRSLARVGFSCLEFDTSVTSTDAMMRDYELKRNTVDIEQASRS